MFLQQLVADGLGWDDTIPEEKMKAFDKWRMGLKGIKGLKVDRWLKYAPGMQLQVHVFFDACKYAYGAVGYAVVTEDGKQFQVTLINAKGRVFPVNEKTSSLHGSMPRRELVGGVLGLELEMQIKDAYKNIPFDIFLWTDSMSVRHWLVNPRLRLSSFVNNRVTKILKEVEPSSCLFCPGEDNPADHASRGLQGWELEKFAHFRDGPGWLAKGPEFWPKQPSAAEVLAAADQTEEKGVSVVEVRTVDIAQGLATVGDDILEGVASRTSSLEVLIRVIKHVRRFFEVSYDRDRDNPVKTTKTNS